MTHDDIIHMAQEADLIDFRDAIPENYIQDLFAGLTRFAELVAAAEREACAAMVKPLDESLAEAIRAGGNP